MTSSRSLQVSRDNHEALAVRSPAPTNLLSGIANTPTTITMTIKSHTINFKALRRSPTTRVHTRPPSLATSWRPSMSNASAVTSFFFLIPPSFESLHDSNISFS